MRVARMQQSVPMSTPWHPAIRADWLVLRRTGPAALARILRTPALLLAACVVLACGDFHGGHGWCLAASVLLALGGSYAVARRRLLDAQQRWRSGWCGALPATRGAMAFSLWIVAAAALLLALVSVAALLFGVAVSTPHRGDLPYALAGIELALAVGVVAAMLRTFIRASHGRPADGIREPLLALRWLNDARLPHWLDWQRRAALVRWRRGGSFAMVGAALAAVPDGPSIPVVLSLVLLVLAWSWLAVVMRASAEAAAAAVRMLGATPLDARCARMVALRYPCIAAVCALVPVFAVALSSGHAAIALAWMACAGAESAWPIMRIFRATRLPDTST